MQKQQKTRKEKKERKRRRRRKRNGDAAQVDPGRARPVSRRATHVTARPRPPRDPCHSATQAAARPRSARGLVALRNPGRVLSSRMNIYFLLLWFSFVFFLNVNRVLETRFPCRCHMEKVPQTTTHENRVPKT